MCNAHKDCLAQYIPETVAEHATAKIHYHFCPVRVKANQFNQRLSNASLVIFAEAHPLAKRP